MDLLEEANRKEEFKKRVEEARNLPILEVATSLGIQIIRAHHNYTQVFCPFHGGDSGVLVHDGKHNVFKCHAGCSPLSLGIGKGQKAFDTLSLAMGIQSIGFSEALDLLLGKVLVSASAPPVRPLRKQSPPPVQCAEPIPHELIDELHKRLMLTSEGEIALAYLASRGIERRTALRWRLGLRPQWEGNLGQLARDIPGFSKVLAAFEAKGFSYERQHEILSDLCSGRLENRQLAWLKASVNTDQLIEEYSSIRHFRSWRLAIPVWEDGPPQDGAGICWGIRYRQVPGLTPDPVIFSTCTVKHRQTQIKYQLLEILPDGAYRLRLKRSLDSEPFIANPSDYKGDDTKCWGQGHVRTLAANNRIGKRFVIAVEGEIDLLSLDQALLGTPLHTNSWLISSTNGASNFPNEWSNKDFWKPYSRIYFAYDKDRAGEEALCKMRNEGVTLDSRPVPFGKDFNDWLIHSGGQISQAELLQWIGKYAFFANPEN